MKLVKENASFVTNALNSGQAHASFSQLGEDGVLWWLFHDKYGGKYVDIGCHDPYRFSNTAVLHLCNGWSGINVDPDPRAIDAFEAHRPSDTNICLGIGLEQGQCQFILFEEGALNSFDPSAGQNASFSHIPRKFQTVEVRTLKSVLDEYLTPGIAIDFLNIDVEGLDQAVLQSNDWDRYQPTVIAVEVHGFDLHEPSASETYRFLRGHGYGLISYVGVTCIFKRLT